MRAHGGAARRGSWGADGSERRSVKGDIADDVSGAALHIEIDEESTIFPSPPAACAPSEATRRRRPAPFRVLLSTWAHMPRGAGSRGGGGAAAIDLPFEGGRAQRAVLLSRLAHPQVPLRVQERAEECLPKTVSLERMRIFCERHGIAFEEPPGARRPEPAAPARRGVQVRSRAITKVEMRKNSDDRRRRMSARSALLRAVEDERRYGLARARHREEALEPL